VCVCVCVYVCVYVRVCARKGKSARWVITRKYVHTRTYTSVSMHKHMHARCVLIFVNVS